MNLTALKIAQNTKNQDNTYDFTILILIITLLITITICAKIS